MSQSQPKSVAPDPEAWGIQLSYKSSDGETHEISKETVDLLLDAMGADSEKPSSELLESVIVMRGGKARSVTGDWTITLEDGQSLSGTGDLPSDLPHGYHLLTRADGREAFVICAPQSCIPVDTERWGWAVQLYAMRSQQSWGMGDLGDLRRFAKVASSGGARAIAVNPLHASLPGTPQETSPYFPSSREFRNLLFLDVVSIAEDNSVDIADLVSNGADLLDADLLDRDGTWNLKLEALERIWANGSNREAFDSYCDTEGEPLQRYATFCVLVETYGRDWSKWPKALAENDNDAVTAFAAEHTDRIDFYQWTQWLIDQQLQAAGAEIDLVQDIAIGVNPAGADAWLWQDAITLGARVGAPPDRLNTKGQNWGLPPLNPWGLRRQRFQAFIRIVRAGFRHAGGLRIDHVMGLFRLYWVPDGKSATEGAYVTYPWEEMLAIVALESHRANAYVVGEDLGTVEKWVRTELTDANILSYKLLWFEAKEPRTYPKQSLATITTHDLPTVVGLLDGSDLERQQEMGTAPNVKETEVMANKVKAWMKITDADSNDEMVLKAAKLLATAPSALKLMTLEDAIASPMRPNYPGTTDEYPNWSVPLPVLLDEMVDSPLFAAVVETFSGANQ